MNQSSKIWLYVDACLRALARCWFLLAIGVAAALMFAAVPQGRVALLAAAEQVTTIYALLLVSLLVSIQATIFASTLLSPRSGANYGRDSLSYAGYFVPGLVGMLPTISLAILTEIQFGANAYSPPDKLLLWRVLRAGVFLSAVVILVIRNYEITTYAGRAKRCASKENKNAALGFLCSFFIFAIAYFFLKNPYAYSALVIVGLLIGDILCHRAGNNVRQRNELRRSALLMVSIAFISGLVMVANPINLPSFLGPASTIYVWLNIWVGVALLILMICRGLPRNVAQYIAITVFAVLTIRFVRSPFNEQTIRTLEPGHHSRPLVAEQVERWLRRREDKIRGAGSYPVFFVSAQGGGIRAAYWTATTLAALDDATEALDDKVPRAFSDHVFAISGASGGSLGSIVYTGIVKAKTLGKLPGCSNSESVESRGKAECLASEVLARDFLSPVLSSFLGSDVLSSILRRELPGDRAASLETGFEQAWAEVLRGNPTRDTLFQDSFDRIWLGGTAAVDIPSLLLNGTDADSGIGQVFSNLDLSELQNVTDMRSLLGDNRFRLSTAVLMSARFPLVSPVGRLDHGYNRIAVVDGGFADNFGSATLESVIKIFLSKAREMDLTVNPIVLAISNEPKFDTSTEKKPPRYSLLQPLGTLERIRQIHTRHLRNNLERWAEENKILFLEGFQLVQERGRDFPLGWMLCDSVRNTMTNQILTSLKDPKTDHALVVRLLEDFYIRLPHEL